jgi:hypothetical protein
MNLTALDQRQAQNRVTLHGFQKLLGLPVLTIRYAIKDLLALYHRAQIGIIRQINLREWIMQPDTRAGCGLHCQRIARL